MSATNPKKRLLPETPDATAAAPKKKVPADVNVCDCIGRWMIIPLMEPGAVCCLRCNGP